MRDGTALGYCDTHSKLMYPDRKSARKAASRLSGHLNAYRCTAVPMFWHVGTLNPYVIQGHVDRSTWYQAA